MKSTLVALLLFTNCVALAETVSTEAPAAGEMMVRDGSLSYVKEMTKSVVIRPSEAKTVEQLKTFLSKDSRFCAVPKNKLTADKLPAGAIVFFSARQGRKGAGHVAVRGSQLDYRYRGSMDVSAAFTRCN